MPAAVASSASNVGESSFTVTKPTGTASGDLLIAAVASDWGTLAGNPVPSGFTALTTARYDGGSNKLHIALGYKIATGSEPSSYSFTVASGSGNVGAVLRITGADGTPTIVQGTPVATLVAPSVTPNGSDDLLLTFHAADPSSSTAATWTPPSGMTEIVDAQSMPGDLFTTMCISALSSPSSPSGTKTATKSGSAFTRNAATTISIKSATTGDFTSTASIAATASITSVPQADYTGTATISATGAIAAAAGHSGLVADISADGRSLVDDLGQPVIPLFDTIWPMVQQAGNTARNGGSATWQQDIDFWVSTRASQGFTALKCNMFGNTISGAPNNDSRTWDSVWPFGASGSGTSGANPSTGQIEAYWQRVDYLMDACAAAGLTLFIHVFYADDVDSGVMAGKSTSEFQALGTFLGNRYKDKPGIVWVVGGDYFDTARTGIQACRTNMIAAGDSHLWTVQNWADQGAHEWTTSRKDDGGATQQLGTAIADINASYIYDPTYLSAAAAWAETPAIPTIWYDGYYDQGTGDQLQQRRYVGWSLTYGQWGCQFGDEGTWAQPNGWRGSVSSPDATISHITTMRAAVAGIDGWSTLVPDLSSTFITAGRSSGNSFVTGSLAADGSLALIYLPVASSAITVDTTQMQAGYTVTWIDPINGATSAGSPGTSFSKGNNSGGSTDWLLLLQAGNGDLTGTTSLAATGSTVSVGVVGKVTAASLALTAAITAVGVVGRSTTASLSATATVTAVGSATAGSSIAAAGTLTAAGVVARSSGVSSSSTVTITPAGSLGALTGAQVAAAAVVTADGSVVAAGTGTAALSAAGAVTAAGVVARSSTAALAGTASLTAVGVVARSGGAAITATASLTADGTSLAAGTGTAAMAGTGAVTVTGQVDTYGAASLAPTVAVTAAGQLGPVSQATGTFTVTITAASNFGASTTAARTLVVAITASGVSTGTQHRDLTIEGGLAPQRFTGRLAAERVTGAVGGPRITGGLTS